jgi:hypothetical protein
VPTGAPLRRFYLAAVKSAPPVEQLPAELRGEVTRAQDMCRRYAAQFETFLMERLTARGLGESSSRRFTDSLDFLLGKRQIYTQQPRYYYFPGLAHIQFFDREAFPWLESVEAATADIRAELCLRSSRTNRPSGRTCRATRTDRARSRTAC